MIHTKVVTTHSIVAPPDGVLKNAPPQLHALERDMDPVEDVASLIKFISEGNPYGDLGVEPDDGPVFDSVDLARRIMAGESWDETGDV